MLGETIRRFLGGNSEQTSPPSSEEVGEALGEVATALEEARRDLARLKSARDEILLHGTPEEAEAHDATIALARREIDRLTAAETRLEEKLTLAGEAEAEGALAARADEGRNAIERYASNLERYAELVEKLVPVIEALQADERVVERLRDELRGTQHYAGLKAPNYHLRPGNAPLHEVAVLPAGGPGGACFHPKAQHFVAYRRPKEVVVPATPDEETRPKVGVFDTDGNEVGDLTRGGRRAHPQHPSIAAAVGRDGS